MTMVSVLLIICLSSALIIDMVGRVYNATESPSHMPITCTVNLSPASQDSAAVAPPS